MKFLTRFKQGGGLRLAMTFTQMGLLPDLLKAGFNVIIRGRSYKQQYSTLTNKIKPLLIEEFSSVLADKIRSIKEPAEKYEFRKGDNKYVWFCWLQGMEKAPEMVKMCLESQKKQLKEKTFIIITADNYKEYISLPDFIEEKYARHMIPDAMFTDLIRIELLIKHGGTWIDSTVMITGDNYPEDIFDCPLFMPQYVSRDGNWCGISSWLITANKENHLLILLREMLLEYWRRYDCVVYYHILHLFFSMIAYEYPDEIKRMPFINSYHCIELLKHLGEHGQSEELKQHLSMVSIHKLSYRLSDEILKDKENTLHELLRLKNQRLH